MPDSVPVALPPARSLKRSASTASLPTPPRTQRKQRHASKSSNVSLSDEEDSDAGLGSGSLLLDSDEETQKTSKHKKRRLSRVQEPEDEDAFWAGVSSTARSKTLSATAASEEARSKSESELDTGRQHSDIDSDSESSFLSRRRLKKSTAGTAPVSPPPSRRRPPSARIAKTKVMAGVHHTLPALEEKAESGNANPSLASAAGTSPPETPKSNKLAAMRDSPNNPFLASPLDIDEVDPEPSKPFREKPSVTYVFRGVKRVFLNPHYDQEKGRARSPNPRSLLPPEHPDFTPDTRGVAKALWPAPKKRKGRGDFVPTPASPTSPTGIGSAGGSGQTLLDSDDEEDSGARYEYDEDDLRPEPLRLFPERPTARS